MPTYLYTVSINGSGIGANVGNIADGFIDPTTIEQYVSYPAITGTSFGTVNIGDSVLLNDVLITFTGTTVASCVSDINALTYMHHTIATVSGSYIKLERAPLHYTKSITLIDSTAGIVSNLGFSTYTTESVSLPTSVTYSLAKNRANWRWKYILEHLQKTCTIQYGDADAVSNPFINGIQAISVSGVDKTFATNTSAISFTVAFREQFYTFDTNNTEIDGANGVQYAIATALMRDEIMNTSYYDPSSVYSNPPPSIAAGTVTQRVEVGALTTVLATAQAAVTVSETISPYTM